MKKWLMDFLRALSGRAEYHYDDVEPILGMDAPAEYQIRELIHELRRRGWLVEDLNRLDSPGHGARVVVTIRTSRPPA